MGLWEELDPGGGSRWHLFLLLVGFGRSSSALLLIADEGYMVTNSPPRPFSDIKPLSSRVSPVLREEGEPAE